MAYTDIDKPSDYFNTKLYTGTGSSLANTGVGFQPNWTWIKNRSITEHHILTDSVRGAPLNIYSNLANAENNTAEFLKSFDSDGFTVGTSVEVNGSSNNMVSWNWRAGTSFTNDASSTGIGATDSAGSVNETAGFSICTYTGVGGTSTTIKHGLSTAPTVMFIKNRDDGDDWAVYHQGIGNTHRLYLNLTDAATDAIGTFRDTSPTSSIFTVGDHASVNTSGEKYVSYIFAEKKGYSKFGKFFGNGNANGTFVYTGFKPAWVMCKNTGNGGAQWLMVDNKRVGINPIENYVQANSNSAEATGTDNYDFLSNGFKCRSTNSWNNQSGYNIIYMAFAENPFTTSTGVPACAR